MTIEILHTPGKAYDEVRFSDVLPKEQQTFLKEKIGLRPHYHDAKKWLSPDHPAYRRYLEELRTALLKGEPLESVLLYPSFDPTEKNIDENKFSYMVITFLTEKKMRHAEYVVFDPYKKVACFVGETYGKAVFGDDYQRVEAYPRNYKRKARILLTEGKVIAPGNGASSKEVFTTVREAGAVGNAPLKEELVHSDEGVTSDPLLKKGQPVPRENGEATNIPNEGDTQLDKENPTLVLEEERTTIQEADLAESVPLTEELVLSDEGVVNQPLPKKQQHLLTNKINFPDEGVNRQTGILSKEDLTGGQAKDSPPTEKLTLADGEAPTDHSLPRRAPTDYLDRVVAHMHDAYAVHRRMTKGQIERLADELEVPNKGMMWEAVELSWMLWYRNLYREPLPFEQRLDKMVLFWHRVQPTYAYSDSSKEIYKQYSTPCPIGAIVAQYTGMDTAKRIFDPSAGNGLLLVGADPAKAQANEIDANRLKSLAFGQFETVTSYNATEPFPSDLNKAFDVVVTNPPFSRWEEEAYDKEHLIHRYFHNHVGLARHLRLEQVMSGLALHTMEDTGRAGIILMGHVYFDADGWMAKYRPFFNWLFRHYRVDDVINMNSFKLYNKQGAIEKTMLVLVSGRKRQPEGVAPQAYQAPHLDKVVDSFQELWERVKPHVKGDLDTVINQILTELTP